MSVTRGEVALLIYTEVGADLTSFQVRFCQTLTGLPPCPLIVHTTATKNRIRILSNATKRSVVSLKNSNLWAMTVPVQVCRSHTLYGLNVHIATTALP
mmetsp:Transcript_43929/g.84358  ORF Transcript_43929/g.84358 Transcript_43929/m.84358 type:complete len:98 (+) Transcript_43929:158-451(+)